MWPLSVLVWSIFTIVACYLLYAFSGLKSYFRMRHEISKLNGAPILPIVGIFLGNLPHVLCSPVWSILIIIACYAFYVLSGLKSYFRMRREVSKMKNIPILPILGIVLGNLPQVLGSPEQLFVHIRHFVNMYKPTFSAWIGCYPSVNTISPEDTEILIASTKNIEKGMAYDLLHCWLGRGLLTSTGEKWHNRRKILTPSFHFSILMQFVETFNHHTLQLVENIKNEGEKAVEITSIITDHTLRVICDTAMNTFLDDKNNSSSFSFYKRYVRDFGRFIVERATNPLLYPDIIYNLSKLGKEMTKTVKFLHHFSSSIIQQRSKEYVNDMQNKITEVQEDAPKRKRMAMLDILLSAKYHDGLIDDEGIREEVDTFVFEGYDTTSLSLCYTLMLLACNKECQDKVYQEICMVLHDLDKMPSYNQLVEMKYMERCIKESLRLYPSVPIISRVSDGYATKDGHVVPKGCMSNVIIYDMHRDPDIWPEPTKFDPDRFLLENITQRHPFAYIPFSAGPRNCIGQRFAMLEIKSALTAVLKNFILQPVDTPETLVLIPDLVLRSRDGLKVKFVSRQ